MTLSHFASQFSTLTHEAVSLVSACLKLPTPPANGDDLFAYCSSAGLSHADVVVPLVHDINATFAVEQLMGHPILRKQVEASATVKQRSPRPVRVDNRVIVYLHPDNPKKPGTRAFRLWTLYTLGMTADDFVAAGGRRSAIRYDETHGFIQLAAAGSRPRINRALSGVT